MRRIYKARIQLICFYWKNYMYYLDVYSKYVSHTEKNYAPYNIYKNFSLDELKIKLNFIEQKYIHLSIIINNIRKWKGSLWSEMNAINKTVTYLYI